MRFEEAYEGWRAGRLTQEDAALVLGVCERSFRRYMVRYEAEGMDGLIDRRLEQISSRRAPVDEVVKLSPPTPLKINTLHPNNLRNSADKALSVVCICAVEASSCGDDFCLTCRTLQ
jgi:hypothetical protein